MFFRRMITWIKLLRVISDVENWKINRFSLLTLLLNIISFDARMLNRCWNGEKEEKEIPSHINDTKRRWRAFRSLPLHNFFQNGDLSVDDSLSSLSETSFNYINSIVGSGVIGIPYALVRAGYGVGLILLVFVAVITDYSLRLMVNELTLIKSF